jgi:prevent-host-death family protein
VLSDDQPICEATVTELNRSPSRFIERAIEGERVIIMRHHQPVAVLVSIGVGLDLLLAGSQRFALMRREAREQLERDVTVDLPDLRWASDTR